MVQDTATSASRPAQLTEATLIEVARRVTGRAALAIAGWRWDALHGGIAHTTGGVYLVRGAGRDADGEHPWSVVLKLARPDARGAGGADPAGFDYWRRELLAYRSPADVLPGPDDGLAAPRCVGAGEDAGGAWLWLEHVEETTPRPWPLARYGLAARHLGAFNGRFLVGRPLPCQPWLAAGLLREYVERSGAELTRLGEVGDTALARRAWPAAQLARMRVLWAGRAELLAAIGRLPRTVCHGDATDLNLLAAATPGGVARTVAVDWAYVGIGALGEDLLTLLRSPMHEAAAGPYPALDVALFAGYLAGLDDVGWDGDVRLARLGFTAAVALRYATNPVLAIVTADAPRRQRLEAAFSIPFEVLLDRIVALREYSVELADEARALARQMTEDGSLVNGAVARIGRR